MTEKIPVDPDLKEALEDTPVEDNLITEYGAMGNANSDNQNINFADKWFPDETEWSGKTNIQPKQARALAAFRSFPHIWDELKELEPFIDQLITNYEQYLTSIDGHARAQHTDILRAMFGGETERESRRRDAIFSAFGANVDGEDT